MLAIVIAAFMAAAAPSPLEVARDKQDRARSDGSRRPGWRRRRQSAQRSGGAIPRRAGELAISQRWRIELRDRKAGRQFAEQGIKFAEKTVALKPENAEYHRLLGTLYGQAITDIMSGLTYGPKAKDAINKAVEKAPKSSMMYVARGVGNYYVPAQLGGGAKLSIPDFQKAIELDPRNAEAYLWLGAQPAQGKSRRRGAAGFHQIAGTQPQPRLGQAAIGKDSGEMKPLATAAVCVALALVTFFQFPGHTWLQQDSQIYVPILEHLRDPTVLRNDILVQHPHVAFTLYDETALALRAVTGAGFREVLAAQQIVTRALGIWGLLLMAEALGLAFAPALLVAAICSLGALIPGPAVLTFEYEPTPRAFAVPLLVCACRAWRHIAATLRPESPPLSPSFTIRPRRCRSGAYTWCWHCGRTANGARVSLPSSRWPWPRRAAIGGGAHTIRVRRGAAGLCAAG